MKTMVKGMSCFFTISLIILTGSAIYAEGQTAEEINRLQSRPIPIIESHSADLSPDEWVLLDALNLAKQEGDGVAIGQIENQLAALRGKARVSIVARPQSSEVQFNPQFNRQGADKWHPQECIIANDPENEYQPEIIADSSGVLFAAYVEIASPGVFNTVLSISYDAGETWNWAYRIHNTSNGQPSLAVGEGTENHLFLAFQNNNLDSVKIFWMDLDNNSQWDINVVYEYYDNMVANPRIVSDSDEYDGWYIYLVFNAMAVDNWVFFESHTIDFGATWLEPEIIGGYCGYPDNFYDGREAFPDIEFGSHRLYVAFDNYPVCTITNRDVFLLTSDNFGNTWSEASQLTVYNDDEHHPGIAAMKNDIDDPTMMVAYTRFFDGIDNDVWYVISQDGGETWNMNCVLCDLDEQKSVTVAASPNLLMFHAAYWDGANIHHARQTHDQTYQWIRSGAISSSNTAMNNESRPGLLVDPTRVEGQQAGVAWADSRSVPAGSIDIYYDSDRFDSALSPVPSQSLAAFSMGNPVPNPCVSGTEVRFSAPLGSPNGTVFIDVYSLAGRKIRTLMGSSVTDGSGIVRWDGRSDLGQPVPSGIYFLNMNWGGNHLSKRVMLVR